MKNWQSEAFCASDWARAVAPLRSTSPPPRRCHPRPASNKRCRNGRRPRRSVREDAIPVARRQGCRFRFLQLGTSGEQPYRRARTTAAQCTPRPLPCLSVSPNDEARSIPPGRPHAISIDRSTVVRSRRTGSFALCGARIDTIATCSPRGKTLPTPKISLEPKKDYLLFQATRNHNTLGKSGGTRP